MGENTRGRIPTNSRAALYRIRIHYLLIGRSSVNKSIVMSPTEVSKMTDIFRKTSKFAQIVSATIKMNERELTPVYHFGNTYIAKGAFNRE